MNARDDHTSLTEGALLIRRRALLLAAAGGALWRRWPGFARPGAVLAVVPGRLPVLDRHLDGLPRRGHAPPARRRDLGLHRPPPGRGRRDDRPPDGALVRADRPGHAHLVPVGLTRSHAAEPAIRAKIDYLNVGFFLVRAVIYFVLWSGLALLLKPLDNGAGSHRGPVPGEPAPGALRARPGAVFPVGTFAMIDWGMSLEPTGTRRCTARCSWWARCCRPWRRW